MSDTKDGRLTTDTNWCSAGTEVRDVRLTKDMVQILVDALAILQPDSVDAKIQVELLEGMIHWDVLKPDCLNDFTL